MVRNDLLDPIRYVAEHSQFVRINEHQIETFVQTYKPVKIKYWRTACPFPYTDLQPIDDEIDFRFIVDSQAFCFWGYPDKWTIDYQGQRLDGWWAMLGACKHAIDNGVPLLDGTWLAGLTLSDTRDLFAGIPEIPLLSERWQILKGIGEVLVEKYNGRFHTMFSSRTFQALELLDKIVGEFPGFNDVHHYQGTEIRFYKKAQLLVNDLAQLIMIDGLLELTGKADYKIPALLRNHGILEYADELARIVDNRIELPSGSEMEIEIRANMLWATELISQKLTNRSIPMSPIMMDNVLWVMSQHKSPTDKPYHLTLTVDY